MHALRATFAFTIYFVYYRLLVFSRHAKKSAAQVYLPCSAAGIMSFTYIFFKILEHEEISPST
jgi:hypothetical protein